MITITPKPETAWNFYGISCESKHSITQATNTPRLAAIELLPHSTRQLWLKTSWMLRFQYPKEKHHCSDLDLLEHLGSNPWNVMGHGSKSDDLFPKSLHEKNPSPISIL